MAALSRAYVPLSEEDDDIDANEREESVDAISTHLSRASVPNITMNTLNYMLVPLSMPATFKAAGWTFGVACLVVSTCWSLVMNARGRFDGTRTTTFIEVQKRRGVRKREHETRRERQSTWFSFLRFT